MPVRLRITILFVVLVIIILGVVCGGIYYFSFTARQKAIQTRLTNRAITTARLLDQKEIFDQQLVKRIDSLTTLSLINKSVQAYDYQNKKVYSYSDRIGDTLIVGGEILDDARVTGTKYFTIGNREAIAYHHSGNHTRLVVISAGEDVEGKKSLQTLLNVLLISFLAGNAIVLFTGYFFSAHLLLPIKKITSDVEEISAQNLARRIKTGTSKDEWYHLASTLNLLLDRLQESFELQRRFISNASHELSTPLTSILSQLEVSFQRVRDVPEYKRVMESIYQDVKHMSKLTKTLLEFATASGSPGGLDISLVRIDEIILSLPSEMARINAEYSVQIQFDDLPENDESLLVFGNEELLRTAIRNIIVNACKYSSTHQASISLKIEKQKNVIIISDKGKGIPPAELKNIFQPFYRVQETSSNHGFGLGLSLADKIIKLHKGKITVVSEVNVGTVFTIQLPTATAFH